ncbi:hypothetical protein BHE74_00002286 [Ensete ventricosum]|nr:hypothetical protein GW17_00020503 [Ensete ventricosum]RWW88822.1 hypothetical protein BHE74_00002286 [Ensete ventricosum]
MVIRNQKFQYQQSLGILPPSYLLLLVSEGDLSKFVTTNVACLRKIAKKVLDRKGCIFEHSFASTFTSLQFWMSC